MKRIIIEIWVFFVKLGNTVSGRLTSKRTFKETVNNKWNKTPIEGNVFCSDGSEYYLLTKANHESKKLLVYFSGGGANWDEKSSRYALSPKNMARGEGKFFENIPPYKMMFMQGMMDERIKENDFNDYTIVYIPYTTGDFHIGDNSVTYSPEGEKEFTVRHNGKNNVEAALSFISKTFSDVETLVIGGESAGGFAASFWAPRLIDMYPNAETTVLVDCSYLVSEKWPTVIKENWGTDFKEIFHYDIGKNPIVDALNYVCANYPQTTVLQIVSLRDQILVEFESEINDVENSEAYTDDWSMRLQNDIEALEKTYSNYNYYFTNFDMNEMKTTRHTFTTWKEYYQVVESGVGLETWVVESIESKRHDSVRI